MSVANLELQQINIITTVVNKSQIWNYDPVHSTSSK